jgi:hypothetical protein
LPFLNCSSHIIVVFDFYTFILFQLNYHPLSVSTILIVLCFRFGYNFSAKPECVGLRTESATIEKEGIIS